jgi:predicted TIM-barrel fold metal-dependent hydrolase
MTTIDMHCHIVLEGLQDALRARTAPPMIERAADGSEQMIRYMGKTAVPRASVEALIGDMDDHAIARAVLSNLLPDITNIAVEDALPLCRAYNDAAAAACAKYPDRLHAFAALPFADMDAAVAEFERAMALPGFVGAVLPCDGFLTEKRAAAFAPLLESADRRRAILLVHYGLLPNDPEAPKPDTSDNRYFRIGTLDMQARISSAMLTFCFTDFLKTYPNVQMMTHNLGGNIPFEVERMDHRSLLDQPAEPLPSNVFRAARLLLDCNSLGSRAIERAVEVYGADKIVFGTDGTTFGMNWTEKAIGEARITEADKAAIRSGNAAAAIARVRGAVAAG